MKEKYTSICFACLLFCGPALRADALGDGLEAERRGDFPGAAALFRQALQERPADRQARAALARAEESVERRRKVAEKETLQNAAEDAGRQKEEQGRLREAREERLAEGRRFLSMGDVLRASDVYNDLLAEDSSFLPAQKGLKTVQKTLNRKIQRGEFPSPRHFAAARGIYSYNEGRFQEAASLLDQALAGGQLPEDLASARLPDYAALARRNLPTSAGRVLTPLVSPSDDGLTAPPPDAPADEAELLYREGLRLFGQDKPGEAKNAFQKALALRPGFTDAREALDRMEQEEAPRAQN